MIIVLGSVEIAPDHLAQALSLSCEHVARSRAEPGCVSHAVYQEVGASNRLRFVEHWTDMGALRQHFAVPASVDFVRALSGMAVARPEMQLFEASALPFAGLSTN